MKPFKLTLPIAKRVLEVVDQGLTNGLGKPTPGSMCIEAAVCYALDLPHSDDPECVSRAVRSLKISLNDSPWSSKHVRADGMRALAVLQLGTRENFDDKEFARRVTLLVANTTLADLFDTLTRVKDHKKHAQALRSASTIAEVRDAATYAANAAYAASNATYAANAANAANAAAYAASNAANAASNATYAANAANYAANAAKRDDVLRKFANGVAKILVDMAVPAVALLPKLNINIDN